MEPRDSNLNFGKKKENENRPIILSIDLNEIPSPPSDPPLPSPTVPDVLDVVLKFHHNPPPSGDPPANFPGETGLLFCGLCGERESRGGTLICDGCERGFHLCCLRLGFHQVAGLDEWVCGTCVKNGVGRKGWQYQKRTAVRLLDINALPQGDGEGEGEGSEQFHDNRMHTPAEDPFIGISFGLQMSNSKLGYTGNGFDTGKGSVLVNPALKSGSWEIRPHGLPTNRSFADATLSTPPRWRPNINNTAVSISNPMQEEIFLQALRGFILERRGVLGEGWHVQFKQSTDRCGTSTVYCAPDGKRFESMSDVARYLGIVSNGSSIDIEDRSDRVAFVQKGLPLRRRRKDLARLSKTNSFTQNQDCDSEIMELQSCHVKSDGKVTEGGLLENGSCDAHHLNIDLPVQYEDFFVLCVGDVDLRPAYHDTSQIWPVGYRSCWHDKITGSLFTCEVSDGGDCGPVFKVRRCPCLGLCLPAGSTVLSHPNLNKVEDTEKVESHSVAIDVEDDEDNQIQMMLSDPSPSDQDILLCFGNNLADACFGSPLQVCATQTGDNLQPQFNCLPEQSGEILKKNLSLKDEIGEFLVEGRSSFSVWRMVSETLVSACRKVYKQSGSVQFFCKHNIGGRYLDDTIAKTADSLSQLAKFCGSFGPIGTPRVIRNDDELEMSCVALEKWLDQDRYGLNMEFVQEIIEQLPGVHACSQYEFLSNRSCYSTSRTVGSGLLLAKRKREGKDATDGLFIRCRNARKQGLVEGSELDHHFPPGRPLSTRLPAELVGDVVQVWELLSRFHEILGLKEPLSFEELEKELIDPWFEGSNFLEKLEKEIQEGRDITLVRTESTSGRSLSPARDCESTMPTDNPYTFIQMETASMKEAAQARVASRTYGRCTGAALTKAHVSLLKVLVGELLSKVAAFVDPNFDAGESKSRRGRKKDVDNSISMKKSKIDMLPINELTWPELARRYILAVSAMDGTFDCAEIASREGGKVFRCLQGDGGVLCGSLAGVAGMEADAVLLAEAEKQISDCFKGENEVCPVVYKDSEANGAYDTIIASASSLPEWAKVLEPVRKLPTNVGTRIRKCVYDALDRGPPDWARKILEHSISKEVYKGNASGPTKKAVLAVLAEVCGESVPQKPDKVRKEQSVNSASNMIMKQCRSILRRAAAADEAKIFCNLLGTTLVNPNDNEDEGILGSPAMVSRPLDFRTIDLRLAVGAYDGSHEVFLEDVREVWHNICTAYGDRSDLMQLAETLSQTFESLYKNEVLSLVQKFAEHGDPVCLNAEAQKELDDALACASEIPKAPWEEGVCKVCGIDKDDDSVLLCDSCDSEYHTYCLNPPLARIPEGNWYCPSCVAGQSRGQDASLPTQVINRHLRRRYQGEGTFILSEALNKLAATMEEKEYWEFSIEERIILLKFLCDEVLNSAVIREHIDQCADMSADLQQKLRSFSIEWRNLKFKEEILTARTAKGGVTGIFNGIGNTVREGMTTVFENHGRWVGQPPALSNRLNGGPEENGSNDVNKYPDPFYLNSIAEKLLNSSNNRTFDHYGPSNMMIAETETLRRGGPVMGKAPVLENLLSCMISNLEVSKRQNPLSMSIVHQQESGELGKEKLAFSAQHGDVPTRVSGVENSSQRDLNGTCDSNVERNISSLSSDIARTHLAEHGPSMPMGSTMSLNADNLLLGHHYNVHPEAAESQHASNLELNSVRNEISLLQDSIANVESQLLKVSLRRDFLGTDSAGRLYWVLGKSSKRPWLVVDASTPVQQKKRRVNEGGDLYAKSSGGLASRHSTLPVGEIYPGASNASSPSDNESGDSILCSSTWVSYDSDTEIQELIGRLTASDSRERELKECILQCQRLRSQQTENQVHDNPLVTAPKSSNDEKSVAPQSLITKAAIILEKRYGPCLEVETIDIPKKRGKKAKASYDERMYRCECLEPVWPSRCHCLSCHQTFCTSIEFEGHNEGKCNSNLLVPDESKENESSREGKGTRPESIREKEHAGEVDAINASKSGKFDFSARVIKFQKKELACPFDLEDISSKFITKNSNRELVQEIGLIGTKGIPSLIPSTPYFLDETVMLICANKNNVDPTLGSAAFEEPQLLSTSQGTGPAVNTPQECLANVINEDVNMTEGCTLDSMTDREVVGLSDSRIPALELGQSCTVPESSLRPLVGKVSQILRRLKINLLDMDAALPEEALKPSRAHLSRRCAWRAFVKSAESIFEMIQATMIFENLIKTEHLRTEWWYWSSLTAAAKTPTLSALSLRIYGLDAAIVYQKTTSSSDPVDNPKVSKPGKKRKDTDR
ncbi:methyl-CpG-binding domain-containing protein 9-like [Tasmannia lanceolata]|uniref:methyl-CpG-binding domain-containing protein 9-like n=1 Tax=Tasmannia lanceolata TaxID=3420 RepID=UPI004063F796